MGRPRGDAETSIERDAPSTTTLQTHRGAALSYEDAVSTPEAVGEEGAECWMLEQI